MTVWLHEERSSVLPYGAPDQRTMFTSARIAIEKLDGTLVAERYAPRDSFAGHQMSTPWDPLHRAYFSGEALWTYLTTPFLLASANRRRPSRSGRAHRRGACCVHISRVRLRRTASFRTFSSATISCCAATTIA
jgi:hypothetical protein